MLAWRMKLDVATTTKIKKKKKAKPSSWHSCSSDPVPREISSRPPTSGGEIRSVQFLLLWLLRAGKSLLPCSPVHTGSCDSPHCQYLANRLEMNTFLHRWLSERTHVQHLPPCTQEHQTWQKVVPGQRLEAAPAICPSKVSSDERRAAGCERSLADLYQGPHLIQEVLGPCALTPGKGG